MHARMLALVNNSDGRTPKKNTSKFVRHCSLSLLGQRVFITETSWPSTRTTTTTRSSRRRATSTTPGTTTARPSTLTREVQGSSRSSHFKLMFDDDGKMDWFTVRLIMDLEVQALTQDPQGAGLLYTLFALPPSCSPSQQRFP